MAIDSTRPHLGRIYDFVLGGHHNYEVDRQAAAQILKVAPSYPKWARANRWFLQHIAAEWERAGVARVLDLASGLPTRGHFNELMPSAKILFSDNDPISVAYGADLLAKHRNMAYRLADIATPGTLLQHASEFFGDQRQVAIACIGVVYLVPDATLKALLEALYNWSAPGSVLVMSFGSRLETGDQANLNSAIDAFRRHAHASMFLRSTEEMTKLAAPWRLQVVRTLPEWLGVPDMFSREEIEQTGAFMSGAIFAR